MTVPLPAEIEQTQTPAWAKLHLGIGLYVSREATLGQAAEIAGLSQFDFQRELGDREIPINYTMDNLTADIRTVRELSAK